MQRSRWLMMMLAALLVWGAVRVVPQALGLGSATVKFGGSLQVGGASPLLGCSISASPPVVPRQKGGGTATVTVSVTCTNRTNTTVNVTASRGALGGTTGTRPTPSPLGWQPSNTMSLPAAGGSGTATFGFIVDKFTTAGTYNLTVTATGSATNVLNYTKSQTVSFTTN